MKGLVGRFRLMESLIRSCVFLAIVAIFLASQLFWIRRARELLGGFVTRPRWRRALGGIGAVVYIFLLYYNLPWIGERSSPPYLTLRVALLEAPFRCWVVGSLLGFAVAILFRIANILFHLARRTFGKILGAAPPDQPPLSSPSRRKFLEQTAIAVSATPFVASTYGLFYGRLNLETTQKRISLRRLPKTFEGFRIVQLSDLHISPFMSAEEISKYVATANRLKADLVALTGDYVTWDPATQEAVVKALSALKAPFGVFGCLGNHEIYTDTQDSITQLFGEAGIRILRGARVSIESHGETLNLIGIDFQGRHGPPQPAGTYLRGVERLVARDTVNILLSHNPNSFDRAADLGIDLSLAGHTHGGQVSLEFIHPSLSPSRLITRYVKGWFQKGAAQLYVNRGIGTIGVPIRLNSRPEITVFELAREA